MTDLERALLEACKTALLALQHPQPLRNANAIYALRNVIAQAERKS